MRVMEVEGVMTWEGGRGGEVVDVEEGGLLEQGDEGGGVGEEEAIKELTGEAREGGGRGKGSGGVEL